MSVRGFRLTIVAVACALVATLAWSAAALAGQEHVFRYSFGPLPAYPSYRAGPETIAVEESTGTVYVDDLGTEQILKFNEAGEPVPFSGLESNALGFQSESNTASIAVDSSAGMNKGYIYAATRRKTVVDIFGPDGLSVGTLDGSAGEPWGFPCGVAVDPSGAVYVSVGAHVDKFVPTGSPVTDSDYVSSLQLPDALHCKLAVDSEGTVYANDPSFSAIARQGGTVERYDALQFGSPSPTSTVIDLSAKAVAVDPSNNHVFTQKAIGEGSEIVEYDSFGAEIETFGAEQLANGTTSGIAVDAANGLLYAGLARTIGENSDGLVAVFSQQRLSMPDVAVGSPSNLTETGVTLNATVNPLGSDVKCQVEYGTEPSYGNTVPCEPEDLGSGSSPVAASLNPNGLEAGVLYHYRFVLSNANGTKSTSDHTFALASKPLIDEQTVLSSSLNGATVSASINPRYYQTAYHFEYGTDESYGSIAPSPDSSIGAGGSDQKVVWSLNGLEPGTTYHIRAVATNQFGTVDGPDETFTTFSSQSSAGSCANATVRQAQNSSYLSDCRAIEMVSPPNKGSSNIATDATKDQAAVDGEAVKYWSTQAFGEVAGSEVPGAEYISRREPNGWITRSITPPENSAPARPFQNSVYAYLTPDLSRGVFYAVMPALPGNPNVANAPSLYKASGLLSDPPGSLTLISDSVHPVPYAETSLEEKIIDFGGASEDLSHIAFEAPYDLTPDSEALRTDVPKAYEWANGQVRLAGILPNGEPASSSIIGDAAYQKVLVNPVSADGSHVIFEAPTSPGGEMNLYMRVNGQETVQLNLSERSEPQTPQPARFAGATSDGSKIFFFSPEALTDDASTGPMDKLYRYEPSEPAGKHLTLISVDEEPSDDEQGSGATMTGMSLDGSYVYFLSRNMLVAGQDPGYWLYAWHDGHIRTVVEHSGNDGNWGERKLFQNFVSGFRITPDGHHAAFTAVLSSTARRAGLRAGPGGEVKSEVYVYDYEADQLVCASCRPGAEVLADGGEVRVEEKADTGANTSFVPRRSRWMSDDGRYVFFDSQQPLLPQASNGRWNVYEYDAATTHLSMISPGSCDCDSYVIETTPDGSNAFFTTHQRLVRTDIDTNADLYDARIDGGIANQNEPATLPCTGESCQAPAEGAPGVSVPASATFSGVGNVSQPDSSKPVVKTKRLTRAQKLSAALRACHKKTKRRRARCEATARRKYRANGLAQRVSRRAGR